MSKPENPLVGRRVRYLIDDQLQFEGVVIHSFYAPDYYRIVIEIRAHPTTPEAVGLVVVVPIGKVPGNHLGRMHQVQTLSDEASKP